MPPRTGADRTAGQVDVIRHRLLGQARLFDDPRAYAAGVVDALEAVTDAAAPDGVPVDRAGVAPDPTDR